MQKLQPTALKPTLQAFRDTVIAVTGCAAISFACARWGDAPEKAFLYAAIGATLTLWVLNRHGLPLSRVFHALGVFMFGCERACKVIGDMGRRFPQEAKGEFMELWNRMRVEEDRTVAE